jgi:hypothetical protein
LPSAGASKLSWTVGGEAFSITAGESNSGSAWEWNQSNPPIHKPAITPIRASRGRIGLRLSLGFMVWVLSWLVLAGKTGATAMRPRRKNTPFTRIEHLNHVRFRHRVKLKMPDLSNIFHIQAINA